MENADGRLKLSRESRSSLLLVHHTYSKRKIDVRLTATTVECFYKGSRIASHQRSFHKGGYTTVAAHMPEGHRKYAEWNPDRFISWASKTGPATASVVEAIMAERPYPEQGFRACFGIMNLAKNYGSERTEAACRRALGGRGRSVQFRQINPQKGPRSVGTTRVRPRIRSRYSHQHPRITLLQLNPRNVCYQTPH